MKVPQYLRCLFGKHLPIGLTDGKRVLFLCDFCMCSLSEERAFTLVSARSGMGDYTGKIPIPKMPRKATK